MPIPANASKSEVFDDLRHGKTYSKTRKKHGRKTANKQMVAIALKHEREKKGKRSRSRR
jgi:hypothetical protein